MLVNFTYLIASTFDFLYYSSSQSLVIFSVF